MLKRVWGGGGQYEYGSYLLSPLPFNVILSVLLSFLSYCIMVKRSCRFRSLGVSAPFSSVALCAHGIAEHVWQLEKKGRMVSASDIFRVNHHASM